MTEEKIEVSGHSLDLLEMERRRLLGIKNSVPIPEDVEASEDKELLFVEKVWKGNVMYQCRMCPFNTFYPEQMRNHLFSVHLRAPAEKKRKIEAALFDPSGHIITEV